MLSSFSGESGLGVNGVTPISPFMPFPALYENYLYGKRQLNIGVTRLTRLVLVKCALCGRERWKEKAEFNKLRATKLSFCNQSHNAKYFMNFRKRQIKLNCVNCNKVFTKPPAWLSKNNFCSPACKKTWQGKSQTGNKNPNWRGGLLDKKCVVCGQKYQVKQHQINSRYCSNRCRLFTHVPTLPELKLNDIIKKHGLPFKYVGNRAFKIGGCYPDFIHLNNKKIALEAFGNYWHSPLLRPSIPTYYTLDGRRAYFRKHGWRLIVLWESEINNLSEARIVEKIMEGIKSG